MQFAILKKELSMTTIPALAIFPSLRGQRVRVELFDQIVTGWARGIDRDGALLVQDDQGKTQRVIAGDVIPLES